MHLTDILGKLENVTEINGEYKANCPAHEDSRPSFTVREKDGRFLLYCHAGCSQEAILSSLGLQAKDLFKKQHRRMGSIVAEYSYQDETGVELFQAVRFEPKDFRQRHYDGAKWAWNIKGVRRVLYNLAEVLKSKYVVIVEGEKDVDRLKKMGIVATTNIGGAGKWRQEYSNALANKQILILPDNDEPGFDHAEKVAKSLFKGGTRCKIIVCDCGPKSDISDWFDKGHTWEEIKKKANEAVEWEPPAKEKQQQQEDSNDKFNVEDILYQMELGTYLSKEESGFYRYEHGVWRRQNDTTIKRSFSGLIMPPKTINKYSQVLHELSVQVAHEEEFDPQRDHINLKNCMYNIHTGETAGHRPDFFSTVQSPIEYKPSATCPGWLDFIEQTLADKNTIECFQEFFGLCFTPITKFQKAAVLYGTGSNGKSVTINILAHMLGKGNVGSIGIEDLGNVHVRTGLEHKLLNCSTEVEIGQYVNTSIFKQIVGGDLIHASHKFKIQYQFAPFCKLLFAANELPRAADKSYGLYRRLLIFPFTKVFEGNQIDLNLEDKLKKEVSGIFNWAIEGLNRLLKNNGFTPSRVIKEALISYKYENSPVLQFFNENCTFDEHGKESIRELYAGYTDWSKENGYKAKGRNGFVREIMTEFPKDLSKEQSRLHEDWKAREYFIKGISWSRSHESKGWD